MDALMHKWLWMEAMNYALEEIKWRHKCYIYPSDAEDEWKFLDHNSMDKNIYKYALDNWKTPPLGGRGRGHGKFSIGHSLSTGSKGVTSTYRDIKVNVTWAEARKMIKEMLEIEDEQITMFEFLTKKA